MLSALLFCAAMFGGATPIAEGTRVYILPMANGFDQYLANRLTNTGLLQVVADAKAGDLIFTDRLGPGFEMLLKELRPEPKPEAKPESEQKSGDTATPPARPTSSFGRGKGTLFLVDVKSRQLVWSAYEPPKDMTPAQLDRTAGRVVDRLRKDLAAQSAPAK